MMQARYGVSARGRHPDVGGRHGLPPPRAVQRALQAMLDHGVYGYYGDDAAYLEAIGWWMRTRHGWEVRPEWIFTTHGLVNGLAACACRPSRSRATGWCCSRRSITPSSG
jgi:cysteine-S-conjugate beta-lyase